MGKTVATFIRVGNNMDSEVFLKEQAMRVQEYCELKGYTIADSVHVIGDRKIGQKLFLDLLASAKDKGIETVVMSSANRVIRSMMEAPAIQAALETSGITLETMDCSEKMLAYADAFIKNVE